LGKVSAVKKGEASLSRGKGGKGAPNFLVVRRGGREGVSVTSGGGKKT